jgi:hypothetical protein
MNPYAVDSLEQQLQLIGWPPSEGVQHLTNPPYVLWMHVLFSKIPFETARILWPTLMFGAYLVVARWLALSDDAHSREKRSGGIAQYLALTLIFPPLWGDVAFGQINIILLLAFLGAVRSLRDGKQLRAGILISLTAFKPHLLLPIYAALGVYSLRMRSWLFLASAVAGLTAQGVLTFFLAPGIYEHYASQAPSIFGEALSLRGASLAQIAANYLEAPWVRTLLILVGLIIGAAWGWRMTKLGPAFTRVLPAVSLAVAPYIWGHSMVLLIPGYLAAMSSHLQAHRVRTLVPLGIVSAFFIGISFRADLAPLFALLPPALLVMQFLPWFKVVRT